MQPRGLFTLGIVLAVVTPATVGASETAYSLKALRALARSAHPTVESAEAAVAAAAGTLRQARAYPNPELAAGVGRGKPRDGGASRTESTIELRQPIELPGLRRWRRRSAESQARAADFERASVEIIVDSTVSRLAYAVLLERRRTEIAEESVQIASRLHDLLQRRVELGESSPLQSLKARSEWFARRRELIDARSALAAARAALNLFCGGRLPATYAIAETLEGSGATRLPADLAERARTRNPALLRARTVVEETRARTRLARKAVFPGFDLVASYETELDREAASVGVGLTIPLWNRRHGEFAAASAEQVRAGAEARLLAQDLERSLARAAADYGKALSGIRLHQEGWTDAVRRALDIATFSFENGEASLLDVLDAQRSYLEVRWAEAESWAALALSRADIELLVAGPLEPENNDETP